MSECDCDIAELLGELAEANRLSPDCTKVVQSGAGGRPIGMNHRLHKAVTDMDEAARQAACWGLRNLIVALCGADSKLHASEQLVDEVAFELHAAFTHALSSQEWDQALIAGSTLIAILAGLG